MIGTLAVAGLAYKFLSTPSSSNEYLKRRQESEDRSIGPIGLGVATTVGLAALATHKPFGMKTSNFMNRIRRTATRTLRGMSSIGDNKEIDRYTKKDLEKLYKIGSKAWRDSKNSVSSGSITLSTEKYGDKWPLASLVHRTKMAFNTNRVKEHWKDTRVLAPQLRAVTRDFENGQLTKNEYSTISKFLADSRVGIETENAYENAISNLGKMDLNQSAKAYALQHLQAMKQKIIATAAKDGSSIDDSAFLQSMIETNKKFIHEVMTIDSLAKQAGTLSKKDIGSGSHATTIKEAMEYAERLAKKNKTDPHLFADAVVINAEKGQAPKKERLDMYKFFKEKLKEADKLDKQLGDDIHTNREKFLSILVDEGNLFTDEKTGKLFTKEGVNETYRDVLQFLRKTLPGQLLKVGDIENQMHLGGAEIINHLGDPTFRALAKNINEEDMLHYRFGSEVYTLDLAKKDFHITLDPDTGKPISDNLKIVSGKYGFYHGIIESISGMNRTKVSDNPLYRRLDIFQDRVDYSGNFFGELFSRVFGESERKAKYYGMLDPSRYEGEFSIHLALLEGFSNSINKDPSNLPNATKEYGLDFVRQIKNVKKLLNENTYNLTEDTVKNISEYADIEKESKKFWELLRKDDKELISTLFDNLDDFAYKARGAEGKERQAFLDKDLEKLVSEYIYNPGNIDSKIELWSNELGESYGTSISDLVHSPRTNQTARFADILRKRLTKEAILRQGWNGMTETNLRIDYEKINELVENVGVGEYSRSNLNKIAQLAIFSSDSKVWQLSGNKNVDKVYDNVLQIMESSQELFTGDKPYQRKLQEVYRDILNVEISDFEGTSNIDTVGTGSLNNVVFTNKSTSVLDIVSGLNKGIKQGNWHDLESGLTNIWEGLTASRDDMSHANLYTFIPYFGIKRLSDELNRVGLGFSSMSTQSTASFAMAFATKSILPAVIGATYLDWLDDTTREATGTGLWEGFVKGVANVDLGARRALSGLGMDEWLKTEKNINPIWQYWGDKDEYQGYDERREYYRDGYEPVRKAAWWTWGSVSEARGGEITYWQPNIVRRAESNYYDNSMYDGYFDKWSHSWLPTPTNPLSPVMALLDPYWLERKHSEDRPYPVSGPMFQEGTPWGTVLNPTVGALIKPEKKLHPFRLRNGIDILALMRGINGSVKQWSDNWHRRNYISVNGGDVTAVNLNMFESPTDNSAIVSINSNANGVSVYGGNAPGVYGTGERNLNPISYGAQGYAESDLGPPIEKTGQDLEAGFNPLSEDKHAALHILAGPEKMSAYDMGAEGFWGTGANIVRNGEIIEKDGQLGIYQDRPLGPSRGSYFTAKQKLEMNIVTSNYGTANKEFALELMRKFNPLDLIKEVNDTTKRLSKERVDNPYEIDEEAAFSTPAKLRSFKPGLTMELLNDADTVSDLMNAGKGSDFVRSAATSIRLIGGIYGYMGSEAIGLGVYNGPKVAKSSDMTSFTRSFWDLNLGGLGGSVSEIGRRFIPNFQRANKLNPLMNNMPDWLPERFRYGDAYASIPKGEMRLPGRGWESLNDYHPDMFSSEEDQTGAFDRFKILADIAPNSEEYKLWREIAKRTVTDPNLIEEMEEIKNRARQQGKKHDFYNYNVVGKNLNYENIVISDILGYGKFKSGDRIFKLAGVSVQGNANENAQQVLNRYLHVGQEVTIATDANEITGTNKDAQHTINAAVFVDGESVSKMMKEAGDARERKGDTSAPAKLADLTSMQQAIGYASEVIGHLDVPILSDQWLRIRSPYESYLAEQVYGTSYMSWSHPINTILKPAIDRAIYTRSITDLLINKAVFTDHGYRDTIPKIDFQVFGKNIHIPEIKLGRDTKHALFMGRLLTNRASLVGFGVGNIINSSDISTAHKFDRRFNEMVTIAHVLTGGRSMLDMAAMGAYLGDAAADFLSDVEAGKVKSHSKYAAIGAVAAMGYRLAIGQAGKNWIPDSTRKKWDMEDYWDRLNYLKYRGLYEEAARRAEDEEGVDIKNALENIDEKEKERSFALEQLEKIRKELNEAYSYRTSPLKKYLLKMVNTRIRELDTDENIVEGGKYTQSAIVYKKAADSTMYGLRENASWSEIVTALPKNDRDYFMEFVSERDPDMRDKILETASPSLRRALLMAWGKKVEAPKSNEEYFKKHYLPDKNWVGWRPDVNLDDVEVKTIENEAMNLSDFGFYESSLRTPGAQAAWGLPFRDKNTRANTAREIKRILNGEGIRNVEVDITDKNSMGPTEVVANIGVFLGLKDGKSKVDEALRAVEY